MAKTSNKRRGNSLIELLNKATSSDGSMSSGAVKDQVNEIKRQARKNNWQGKFSRLLDKSPDWVELAEDGVSYIVDKDGKEKGVFPVIRNNVAVLKVVM